MIQSTSILNYKIIGDGNPVVFLHGFLESNFMWEEIIPELPMIKAICIELPGHGESQLLSENLSLPSIANAVKQTLDSLAINSFSIVGHSLGGYVALYLAGYSSLKIEHIVLLHSHPWPDNELKKKNRNRAAKIVDYNKLLFLKEAIPNLYYENTVEQYQSEIERLIEEADKMSIEAIQQHLFAMRDREDKSEVLQQFGDKLHIIQGEFDHLIEASRMEKIAAEYKNNFCLIRDIGHMGHDEAKAQVIQQLDFLQEN